MTKFQGAFFVQLSNQNGHVDTATLLGKQAMWNGDEIQVDAVLQQYDSHHLFRVRTFDPDTGEHITRNECIMRRIPMRYQARPIVKLIGPKGSGTPDDAHRIEYHIGTHKGPDGERLWGSVDGEPAFDGICNLCVLTGNLPFAKVPKEKSSESPPFSGAGASESKEETADFNPKSLVVYEPEREGEGPGLTKSDNNFKYMFDEANRCHHVNAIKDVRIETADGVVLAVAIQVHEKNFVFAQFAYTVDEAVPMMLPTRHFGKPLKLVITLHDKAHKEFDWLSHSLQVEGDCVTFSDDARARFDAESYVGGDFFVVPVRRDAGNMLTVMVDPENPLFVKGGADLPAELQDKYSRPHFPLELDPRRAESSKLVSGEDDAFSWNKTVSVSPETEGVTKFFNSITKYILKGKESKPLPPKKNPMGGFNTEEENEKNREIREENAKLHASLADKLADLEKTMSGN